MKLKIKYFEKNTQKLTLRIKITKQFILYLRFWFSSCARMCVYVYYVGKSLQTPDTIQLPTSSYCDASASTLMRHNSIVLAGKKIL